MKNLKTLREKKGWSQETLAGKLNIDTRTIQRWEKDIVPDKNCVRETIRELLR